jgi:hypothetical protein
MGHRVMTVSPAYKNYDGIIGTGVKKQFNMYGFCTEVCNAHAELGREEESEKEGEEDGKTETCAYVCVHVCVCVCVCMCVCVFVYIRMYVCTTSERQKSGGG